MNKPRSFAGSFCRVTHDKEKCGLKNHYRGAMREVVGFLDMLAANDPERFVYCGVNAIQQHCKKYQSQKLHTKSWAEKLLAELRRRHVVSGRLVRVRRHEEVVGFIVAPHSCLTELMADGSCIFRGPVRMCGRWQRTGDAGPGSVLYWAGCAAHSMEASTVRSAEGCAEGCADTASAQPTVETTLNSENAALTVVAARTKEPRKHLGNVPALPAESNAAPENQQRQAGQAGCLPPSSSSPSKTTPTPRQRFLAFINNTTLETPIPDSLRTAMPKEDEFPWIVKQLDAIGEEKLADILYDWEEQQSPPLMQLKYGRWTRWLETGKAAVAEAIEDIKFAKEWAAKQAAKAKV